MPITLVIFIEFIIAKREYAYKNIILSSLCNIIFIEKLKCITFKITFNTFKSELNSK